MIASKDRSDWFGASDTSIIMGSWNTKTFAKWWMQKLGVNTQTFFNSYTQAGTYWEHEILEYLGAERMDRQILLPKFRLRINLDGEKDGEIIECKTYKLENGYDLPKAHVQQVQVQMWGAKMKGRIAAYGLADKDYDNYFRGVDEARLTLYEIGQDERFIANYIARLRYLAECLNKGIFPQEEKNGRFDKRA